MTDNLNHCESRVSRDSGAAPEGGVEGGERQFFVKPRQRRHVPGRIVGKLQGRRAYLDEPTNRLILPDNAAGQAVFTALYGEPPEHGQACVIQIGDDQIETLRQLIASLFEMVVALQQTDYPESYYWLRAYDIGHQAAARLAADGWVTKNKLRAWDAAIRNRAIANRPGFLVDVLSRHELPPRQFWPEEGLEDPTIDDVVYGPMEYADYPF